MNAWHFPENIFKSTQSSLIKIVIVIIQTVCSNQINSFRACYLNNIIHISRWAINWCVHHEETTAQYRIFNSLSHCMSVTRNIPPNYDNIKCLHIILPITKLIHSWKLFQPHSRNTVPSFSQPFVSSLSQIIICVLYTQALFRVFPLFSFFKANAVGGSL